MEYKWLQKRRVLPLIIIVSFILGIILVKSRPSIQHEPESGFITPVKFIDVKRYLVRPAIKGYGLVEPDILFESKSEIAGKIIFVHPQLRDGAVFPKDTVVIRIEEEDFELTVRQAEADSDVSRAKLREIKLKQQNTRVDLKLAKEKLTLAKKDLNRLQKLLKKGVVSQSSFDAQQTNVLKLQQEVQNMNSLLRTLPEQQKSLEAGLANTEAALQSQQRNLDRTTIQVPFNARISSLAVDENQFIEKGALLFTAQTTDKILINAQFPIDQFRTLAMDFSGKQELIRRAFQTGFSSQLFSQLGLSATVRITDNFSATWQGTVERFSSTLDPATRTLGIIISVDRPYEQIQPGIKPPLIEGMYTEITLQGEVREFYLVPRDALHEDEIFLINKDNQLERRFLKPRQVQGGMALFETGIAEGDRLIVSDLFPAVPGMLLKPVQDALRQQKMAAWAESR